jgi:XTP/dITP diphosphohydrolase
MKEIVLATSNKHKVQEVQDIVKDWQVKILSLADFGLTSPEETGVTFADNALLKARYVLEHINFPVLADDSGLMVAQLNGDPGLKSGRYAGIDAKDVDNREKLKRMLEKEGIFKAKAKYYCCMVFINPQNSMKPIIRTGTWLGEVRAVCSGNNGFGYDPMFYISKLKCTVADLKEGQKNKISHRYKAMSKLKKFLV